MDQHHRDQPSPRKGKHDARFEALSGFEACLEIGVDSTPLDIAKILQASRPADRRIFEQQLGGLSTAEIAENHGISTIAIRLRVFRARRNVRAALAGPPAARVAAAA
ncbi:MAG: sigma factor-like helix-turn-helix DNA-binding protein [Acidobacteriota bacterium]